MPLCFSVYSATNAAGNSMTVMVLNKDPNNSATAHFNFNGFTPSQVRSYTLSPNSPTRHRGGGTAGLVCDRCAFAPYTATLLVITGSSASVPAAEWDLNPDTIMISAGGQATLHPKLVSGSTSLTLSVGTSDSGITPTVTSSTINGSQTGAVLIAAGNAPGFYHFNVRASDGTLQGGWIVVGNPPASLAKTAGDSQSAPVGTVLPVNIPVTLSPASPAAAQQERACCSPPVGGASQNLQVGSEQIFRARR